MFRRSRGEMFNVGHLRHRASRSFGARHNAPSPLKGTTQTMCCAMALSPEIIVLNISMSPVCSMLLPLSSHSPYPLHNPIINRRSNTNLSPPSRPISIDIPYLRLSCCPHIPHHRACRPSILHNNLHHGVLQPLRGKPLLYACHALQLWQRKYDRGDLAYECAADRGYAEEVLDC